MGKNKKRLRHRIEQFHKETQEIRNFSKRYPNYSLKLIPHAKERTKSKEIDPLDILRVINKGKVVRCEPDSRGEDRYTLRGKTVDGEEIEVVLKLDYQGCRIKVVTAWKK